MEKIRKKKKRRLPKLVYVVIPPLLAGAVWGLSAYLDKKSAAAPARGTVEDRLIAQAQNKHVHPDEKYALADYAENYIFSIRIQPLDDEAYTLSKVGDHLYPEGDADYPMRTVLGDNMIGYACTMPVMETIGTLEELEGAATKADFGFSPAACEVTVTYTDGTRIPVLLGASVMQDDFLRYYMLDERDNTVYIISSDMYDSFTWKKHMLHTVQFSRPDTSLIDRISFSTQKGGASFALRLQDGHWYVDAPESWPADSSTTESLLKKLKALSFSSYVGEGKDVDLAQYGLDQPQAVLTIENTLTRVEGYDEQENFHSVLVPGETHTLLIGNAFNTVSYYCLYDDTVFIGTDYAIGFVLSALPDRFYSKNPVNIAANELSSVTVIAQNGTAVRYDISLDERVLPNGELETDPGTGELLHDVTVTKDGSPVDTTAFLSWYYQLTQVSAMLKAEDAASQSGVYCTVIIQSGNTERSVEFVRTKGTMLLLRTDGTPLYLIQEEKAAFLNDLP